VVFDLDRMVEPMSVRCCLRAAIAREGACKFCVRSPLWAKGEQKWTFNII